jgi:hypothetical protein
MYRNHRKQIEKHAMTAYKRLQPPQSLTPSTSVQEVKAKRQAVLARVRKQRAQAYRRHPKGNTPLEELASK